MSMMNSTRSLSRSGFAGCKCCFRVPTAKTTRTRERRAWRKDAATF